MAEKKCHGEEFYKETEEEAKAKADVMAADEETKSGNVVYM